MQNTIANRKDSHLSCLSLVECAGMSSGFEKFRFEHNALPEVDFNSIDTSTKFLGRNVDFPIIISPITGGTPKSEKINIGLAEIANDFNIGLGVGSQRIMLEDSTCASSFKIRNYAPRILLFANLGAVQLNYGYSVDECKRAVDAIDADALMLHLNPLQEAFQPEGNVNFSNLLSKIERVCSSLDIPVVVKEVGYGISASVAKRLYNVGVKIIDVAGSGSISWTDMESARSDDIVMQRAAETFRHWGNSTAECVMSISDEIRNMKIIASGGIKTGLDIAKAIALGADICGNASDFLAKILKSRSECENFIETLKIELKTAMFCVGCKNLQELRSVTLQQVSNL